MTGWSPPSRFDVADPDVLPWPALDLCHHLAHAPLMTSRGCPFHCAYCASRTLQPVYARRRPVAVVDEIRHWHTRHGVIDFAFYDDALLVDAERHIVPILEGVIRAGLKLRFHTPNALHIREITGPLARLMHRAGFHTIRLGLETTAFEQRQSLDGKVTEAEFSKTVDHLKAAGFTADQVGAYLLAGLPGAGFPGGGGLDRRGQGQGGHAGDRPLHADSAHPHVGGRRGVVALRPGGGPRLYQQCHFPLPERTVLLEGADPAKTVGAGVIVTVGQSDISDGFVILKIQFCLKK